MLKSAAWSLELAKAFLDQGGKKLAKSPRQPRCWTRIPGALAPMASRCKLSHSACYIISHLLSFVQRLLCYFFNILSLPLSLSPPLLFSTLVLECRSFQLDFLPFSFASILAPTSKLFSFAFPSHSPQCRRELRVHGRHRSSDYLHTCRDLCGATHVRLGAFGAFGAPPRPPRSEAPGTGCSRRWCKGSRPTWNGCAMALNPL